jgi:hypothetical protein
MADQKQLIREREGTHLFLIQGPTRRLDAFDSFDAERYAITQSCFNAGGDPACD